MAVVELMESESLTWRARHAAEAALKSSRPPSLRGLIAFAGPAVVASIAYIDPGNIATNVQAGSKYGYALLWVVVLANLIAMLFQGLSARLGLMTGETLASLARRDFPRPVSLAMWGVSEIAAMATDVAELLGAALGLSLLTGLAMLPCLLIAGAITYGILSLQSRGFRPLELVIGGFLLITAICYAAELIIASPDWGGVLRGAAIPSVPDIDALTLVVGIIGATVMPHAIFLHSALTQSRLSFPTEAARARAVRWSDREVIVALLFAGLINLAMITMAAAVFHGEHSDIAEIADAYRTLTPLLGGFAGAAFIAALLASGFASSVVGTMAGDTIMRDLLRFRVPLWLRRLVTMLPSVFVVAAGVDVTRALVLSQVILSVALPVPMVALVLFASRPALMGARTLRPAHRVVAWAATAVVATLNVVLLAQVGGVPLPFAG